MTLGFSSMLAVNTFLQLLDEWKAHEHALQLGWTVIQALARTRGQGVGSMAAMVIQCCACVYLLQHMNAFMEKEELYSCFLVTKISASLLINVFTLDVIWFMILFICLIVGRELHVNIPLRSHSKNTHTPHSYPIHLFHVSTAPIFMFSMLQSTLETIIYAAGFTTTFLRPTGGITYVTSFLFIFATIISIGIHHPAMMGTSAKDIALTLKENQWFIKGFRSSSSSRVLNRYVYQASLTGSVCLATLVYLSGIVPSRISSPTETFMVINTVSSWNKQFRERHDHVNKKA
jgi:preprotein translocase subunit SecY